MATEEIRNDLKEEFKKMQHKIEKTFNTMETTSDDLTLALAALHEVITPLMSLFFTEGGLDQRVQNLLKKEPGLKEAIRDWNKQNAKAKLEELSKENKIITDRIKDYKEKIKVISTLKPEEALRLINECTTFQIEYSQAQRKINNELTQFIERIKNLTSLCKHYWD